MKLMNDDLIVRLTIVCTIAVSFSNTLIKISSPGRSIPRVSELIPIPLVNSKIQVF